MLTTKTAAHIWNHLHCYKYSSFYFLMINCKKTFNAAYMVQIILKSNRRCSMASGFFPGRAPSCFWQCTGKAICKFAGSNLKNEMWTCSAFHICVGDNFPLSPLLERVFVFHYCSKKANSIRRHTSIFTESHIHTI